jgi:hypothetical protein
LTKRCQRFEQEALLLLEQGLPLDAHFYDCADCREAREAYLRIQSGLRGASETPRPGWESKVLDAINRAPQRGAAWGRRSWAGAAIAAGTAGVAVAFALTRPRAPAPLSVTAEIVRAERSTLRSSSPQPGDELKLTAVTGGARYAELRVYREDRQLVLRCFPPESAGAISCSRAGDQLQASLRLPSPGAFQALVAASDVPLPAPAPTLAEDTESLLRAGARIAVALPIRAY